MVNTFLTSTSFVRSAQLLDRKRLGKQRVEAQQILDCCLKLRFLGTVYNNPMPDDPYQHYDWIRQVATSYKQSNFSLVVTPITSEITLIASTTQSSLGWVYHPAVLMWVKYTDALKEYIDVHIEEWLRRGYQNTMTRYTIRGGLRPTWTYDADFIGRHRSMLLQKEIDRSEPTWYQTQPQFVAAGTTQVYFWPYTSKTGAGESDARQRYKTGFILRIDDGV